MTDDKELCDQLDAAIRDVVDYRNKAHPDQKPAVYLTNVVMRSMTNTGAAPPTWIRHFDVPTGTAISTGLEATEADWEEKK